MYAILKGMSPEDGSNFSFRLFKDRAVVGYVQEGETSFYPNCFVLSHLFSNNQQSIIFCK